MTPAYLETFCADQALSAWLTPAELSYFQKMKAESRRRDWLAGRLAAKRAIQQFLESYGTGIPFTQIEIINDAFGAPAARLLPNHLPPFPGREEGNSPLRFGEGLTISISHSEGHGLAGLSEKSCIGVDLQKIRVVGPRLMECVLSERERDQLANHFAKSHNEGLIVFWAVKEAAVKAQRTRPAPRFHEIEVLLTGPGQAKIFVKGQKLSARWGRHGDFIWACAFQP